MKHLKKLACLLLALALALVLAAPAFAADNGMITVNNPIEGRTYAIYKILTLESYNAGAKAYSYKPASEVWKAWLETQTDYVTVDPQGYVTWVDGADAAAFAKAALAHAKANSFTAAGSVTAEKGQPVVFENLPLGYYLLDSSMGTLCSLGTTATNVEVEEKNEAPENEKTVEENGAYGDKNDAAIGDIVRFQSTITPRAGAENYVFHDKMSDGLTLVKEPYDAASAPNGWQVTLNGTPLAAADHYTFVANPTDGDTFDILFEQTFCDTLTSDDEIVIRYAATLNEKAKVGTDPNTNESKLSYGETGKTTNTPPSTTKTYTWDVDIFKYTGSDTPLAGAVFTLSKNADGTDPIALVGKGGNTYRVAKAGEAGNAEVTTDATGKFTVAGLDSGIYYLTEIKQPDGYNKLAGPVEIEIDGADGHTSVVTAAGTETVTEVKVENKAGALLPSTGGMGTTLFYLIGAVLAVGAAVLLAAKRRMDSHH